MARFSSVGEFSPAGTNLTGTSTSNSINTTAAKDARVFLNLASVPGGGATLDVEVEISPDNVDFATVRAFNAISATGKLVLALAQEELGSFTRLKYIVSSGTFTLGAKLEKKQGV